MSGLDVGPAHPATHPIDPLATAPGGRYDDGLVVVQLAASGRPRRTLHCVRTPHFDVERADGRLRVTHALDPTEIDDDLCGLVARELVSPGWVVGNEVFERILTGLVLTSHPDPLRAWDTFYRNTLDRLDALIGPPRPPGADATSRTPHAGPGTDDATWHGSLAGYAPVYAHAERLVVGSSVLELGSCFGFLSLRLAASGLEVTGSDVAPGTVRLLRVMSSRLGRGLRTCVADATRVPLGDGHADTVLLVHLLEHLDAHDGYHALAQAIRLARLRVVVAVPYEEQPDPAYGHVRTLDATVLRDLATGWGWHADVHDNHGGWLVLDPDPAPSPACQRAWAAQYASLSAAPGSSGRYR